MIDLRSKIPADLMETLWKMVPDKVKESLDKMKESLDKMIPDRVKDVLRDEESHIYVAIGTTLVVVMLYIILAIVPGVFMLSKTSREIRDLNDQITLVNARVNNLDKRTELLTELKQELAGYSEGLPHEKDIPVFLEDLSSMAKASRIKILGITPSELRTVETGGKSNMYYKEMLIVITAKSGYHQLGQFISNLEHGKRFITIEGLQVQYDRMFPRMHTVKIELKTYVSIDDKQ